MAWCVMVCIVAYCCTGGWPGASERARSRVGGGGRLPQRECISPTENFCIFSRGVNYMQQCATGNWGGIGGDLGGIWVVRCLFFGQCVESVAGVGENNSYGTVLRHERGGGGCRMGV